MWMSWMENEIEISCTHSWLLSKIYWSCKKTLIKNSGGENLPKISSVFLAPIFTQPRKKKNPFPTPPGFLKGKFMLVKIFWGEKKLTNWIGRKKVFSAKKVDKGRQNFSPLFPIDKKFCEDEKLWAFFSSLLRSFLQIEICDRIGGKFLSFLPSFRSLSCSKKVRWKRNWSPLGKKKKTWKIEREKVSFTFLPEPNWRNEIKLWVCYFEAWLVNVGGYWKKRRDKGLCKTRSERHSIEYKVPLHHTLQALLDLGVLLLAKT